MTDELKLEEWRKLKEHTIAAFPVPLKGYAIVGIGEDGHCHWGAHFGLSKRECQEMIRRLNTIAKDVAWFRDRYALEDTQ